MRQVEQDIVNAVRYGAELRVGTSSSYIPVWECYRDSLHFEKEKFTFKLWGNVIAEGNTATKEITVSDCGYATATTVSRLNAIFAGLDIPMSASVHRKETIYRIHGEQVKPGELHYYAGKWIISIR